MKNRVHAALLASLMVSTLAGCKSKYEAHVETGIYKATGSSNVDLDQWDTSRTITANVNRDSETVVFAMADGSKMTLHITSLPEDQWGGGCATFGTYTIQEIVKLSPAPITLLDLTFTTPALEPMCSPDILSLEESNDADENTRITFERVK